MSAQDRVIRKILEHTKAPGGELNPLAATAQLTACYPDSWVDKAAVRRRISKIKGDGTLSNPIAKAPRIIMRSWS
jgi:hypothetical protein